MKCKKCEAELEEGVSLCSNCGFDNSEENQAPTLEENCEAEISRETVEALESTEQESAVQEENSNQQELSVQANEEQTEDGSDGIHQEKANGTAGIGPGKIALLVVLGILAVAVVVALIMGGLKGGSKDVAPDPQFSVGESTQPAETTEPTIPADGNPDDVTCKGSYYVSDEEIVEARDTVVATLGDAKLTNGELQVYYWMSFYDFLNMYGNYISAMGLNPMQSLDTQVSIQEGQTWQQFLLNGAIENWRNYQTLAMKAKEAGYELSEEYEQSIQAIPEELLKNAVNYGYETAEQMVQGDMGKGATMDDYLSYMTTYYLGHNYYSSLLERVDISEDALLDYFNEHSDEYTAKGLTLDTKFVDARHILFTPEGGTTDENGTVTYSEEEWEACRAAAQAVLDEYLAGDQTEDSFAALAQEHSQDPGSKQNGGLYESIYKGQMVKPFEDWCFDDARVEGDTGLVKTEYGYHVMYFKHSRPAWMESARADLMTEKGHQILQDMLDEYEMDVNYSAIKLGNVDTSAGK